MSKHYIVNGLTIQDLHNLEVATRLRVEACEENIDIPAEKADLSRWLKTHNKILKAIDRIQGTIPPSDPLRKMPR